MPADPRHPLHSLREVQAEELETSIVLLRSLRGTLTDLLSRVSAAAEAALGDGGPPGPASDPPMRDLLRKQKELETAVKEARELEKRLDAWTRNTDSGEVIDFDLLRQQIQHRINALLNARGEEGIPDEDVAP